MFHVGAPAGAKGGAWEIDASGHAHGWIRACRRSYNPPGRGAISVASFAPAGAPTIRRAVVPSPWVHSRLPALLQVVESRAHDRVQRSSNASAGMPTRTLPQWRPLTMMGMAMSHSTSPVSRR